MDLEQQVISLEIAKRLKELQVEQKSLVHWLNIEERIHVKVKENGWEIETDENGSCIIDSIDYRTELGNPIAYNVDKDNCWSAFTASELANMLPNTVDTKINEPFNNFRLWMTKSFIVESDMIKKYIYIINYKCDSTECVGENAWLPRQLTSNIHDSNLSNALALMLIYLIENGLMEIKK